MFKKIIFVSCLSIVSSLSVLADSCPLPSSLSMSGGYVVAVDSAGLHYQSTLPYPNHNPANSNFFTVLIRSAGNLGSAFVTGNPRCHYLESDGSAFTLVSTASVTPSNRQSWEQVGAVAMCDSNAHIPAQCPYT